MIPRFKKKIEDTNQLLKKEEFLEVHNKLSPQNLKATLSLLTRFKEEKSSLFHGDNWQVDKVRRPFILWLSSLHLDDKSHKVKFCSSQKT